MQAATPAFEAVRASHSKEPLIAIKIFFSDDGAEYHWFTSHADCLLPDGETNVIHGVIAPGSTSVSQELKPLEGNASIGNTPFKLRDPDAVVGTLIRSHLDAGRGLSRKKVEIYIGDAALVSWDDYLLFQTQWIKAPSSKGNFYTFKAMDIQREMRKDIFDVKATVITQTVNPCDATINVLSTDVFEMVAHGTSYTDAPSQKVGYLRLKDTVIRYTGKTATTFTGCMHGVLNTRAAVHEYQVGTDAERQVAVEEFIYLEMPAIKISYALLTGSLYGQPGEYLPDHWHLGISTSYISTAGFTFGMPDLWDTANDQAGVVFRFEGLKKEDGKKFIEKEINLPLGVFMPTLADGSLTLRRMTGVLSSAAYVKTLDHSNLTAINALDFDHTQIVNIYGVDWNYDFLSEKFTRPTQLIDLNSITINKRANKKSFKFRGLHGSRHTAAMLGQRFDALRDRYAGEPLLISVTGHLSLSALEVGDIIRLNTDMVRDYTGKVTHLDRAFEVQRKSINWETGKVDLKLFGSSMKAEAIVWDTTTYALPDAFYGAVGTDLSTVLTINDIGGVGHIQANGNLAGGDTLAAGTYYYLGDLELDSGFTLTINKNVQLNVQGHFQCNGKIDGRGRGHAGAIGSTNLVGAAGTAGYLGATRGVGGIDRYTWQGTFSGSMKSLQAIAANGQEPVLPSFALTVSANDLLGLPPTLIGTSGGAGGAYITNLDGVPVASFEGGSGGASGAGLAVVPRGLSFGINGSIDTSGVDGTAGEKLSILTAGAGTGGAPGGCMVILDGSLSLAPAESKIIANAGTTPTFGVPIPTVIHAGALGRDSHSHFSDITPFSGDAYTKTIRLLAEQTPVADMVAAAEPVTSITLQEYIDTPKSAKGNLSTIEITAHPPIDPDYRYSNIYHRVTGTSAWTKTDLPAAPEALAVLSSDGTQYDFKAHSVSVNGVESPSSVTAQITVSDMRILPPRNLTITEELYQTIQSGGVKAKAVIKFESSSPLISGYQVEYKLATDLDYLVMPVTAGTTVELLDIVPGTYDIRVKGLTDTGISGEFASLTKRILGLTAPPADVSGFVVVRNVDRLRFSWYLGDALDLHHYEIRRGTSWSSSVLVGTPTSAPFEVMAAQAGTYLIKAVDLGGVKSLNATTVVISSTADINVVVNHSEQGGGWNGTKSNIIETPNGIELAGTKPISAFTDPISSYILSIAQESEIAQTGTYITETIDLGVVLTSRIEIDPVVEQIPLGGPISSWTQPIAFYSAKNGYTIAGPQGIVSASFEIDISSNGSDWDGYREFIPGDYSARYIRFRCTLNTGDQAYNCRLSQFDVAVDVPDRVIKFNDEVIPSGGKRITFSPPFYAVPVIDYSMQGGAVGDTIRFTNKTTDHMDVEIFDSTGTTKAGNTDIKAEAY